MPTVGTVRINSVVNNRGLRKGFDEGRSALGSFVGAVTAGSGKVVAGFGAIGLAVQGVKSIFGGITSVVGTPLKLAAEAQQTAISFSVLTGSVEQGNKTLGELRQFAASTPFSFDKDIAPSARSLLAFGFSAEEVTGELRKLSDISSGLSIPMGELSEMYGKMAVGGRIMGEDINAMLGRGIPIVGELAKQFGVAESEVKNLVSSGAVNFSHIKTAISDLTAEQSMFGGLTDKLSGSLGGVWSTLQDNITMALTEIGVGIADTFDLTAVTTSITGFVQSTIPLIKSWMQYFKDTFAAFQPIFIQAFNVLSARFTSFYDITASIFGGIMGFVGQFLPTWTTFRDSLLTAMITAEFAFTNWRKISELAVSQVIASVLGFAGEIAHTFTVVIPSYLSYLFDNWQHVLGEIGRVGQLMFGNFANNVVNIITSIPDLLRGKVSFSDLWTPLTDEATLQFKNLPDIPERVMGDMERSMRDNVASLSDELGNSFADMHRQRMGELVGDKPAQIVPELNKPALSTAVDEVKSNLGEALGEIKLADAAGFRTQEARSAILRNKLSVPSETSTQKELNQINKDQLSVQRETLRVMKSRQRQEESVVAI